MRAHAQCNKISPAYAAEENNFYKDRNLRNILQFLVLTRNITSKNLQIFRSVSGRFVFFLNMRTRAKILILSSNNSKNILPLTTNVFVMYEYRVIQEERSIIWDILVSVIVRKYVDMNMCIILMATEIQLYQYFIIIISIQPLG
jgi:hypothetical protein